MENVLVTKEEIEEILRKYNIGKKPLSLVLGFGEVTVFRYLEGERPSLENSEILKMVLNNPVLYELFLLGNQDKISKVAFRKSMNAVKKVEFECENSKLYALSLLIIDVLEDVTPNALQKVLYFINGFSSVFLHHVLFSDLPEAWINGPVYREIYDCFSYYKNGSIDISGILEETFHIFNDDEMVYVRFMIVLFGSFSGAILREFSKMTQPWIDARIGLEDNEISDRVIEKEDVNVYFQMIYEKYKMKKVEDVFQYVVDLHKKIINKEIGEEYEKGKN